MDRDAVPAWQLTTHELREMIAATVRTELAKQRAPASRPETDERLTVGEVAKALRCCERQVRRLLSLRRLRATKDGRRVFVLRSELTRYQESL